MTDQLDRLFQEMAADVADDGFSENVMQRIQRPRLVRRLLTGAIVLLTGWLAMGPLGAAFIAVGTLLSDVSNRWFDPVWLMQNPATLIAVFACVAIPLIIPALSE